MNGKRRLNLSTLHSNAEQPTASGGSCGIQAQGYLYVTTLYSSRSPKMSTSFYCIKQIVSTLTLLEKAEKILQ